MLGTRKLLVSTGIIRRDGKINSEAVIELLKEELSDEHLKELIIRFALENLRNDIVFSSVNIRLTAPRRERRGFCALWGSPSSFDVPHGHSITAQAPPSACGEVWLLAC